MPPHGLTPLCQAYLGVGIGFLIGTVIGARFVDRIYLQVRYLDKPMYIKGFLNCVGEQRKAKNGGVARPEDRIPVMFVGSILVPVGLL